MKSFIKAKWRDIAIVVLALNLIFGTVVPVIADTIKVQPPLVLEIDDIPVDGETEQPISSNWAFDYSVATTGILKVLDTPVYLYTLINLPATPRTQTIDSIADDVITLAANEAHEFFQASMVDNSYLKIANTSKDPVQYAWVKAAPAINQLQVTVAADIADWVNGNTISTAYDGGVSQWLELDISPTIPDGAIAISAKLQLNDTGVIAGVVANDIAADPTGTYVSCLAQVSGLWMIVYPISKITAARHIYIRDRASGVGTLSSYVLAIGYFI